jgi:hypothetical protein
LLAQLNAQPFVMANLVNFAVLLPKVGLPSISSLQIDRAKIMFLMISSPA